LRRWAAAEPAMLADEGLGAEACRRFANIKTLERDLEIHTAIATVREDGQFQHLYAEADVRAAVAEVRIVKLRSLILSRALGTHTVLAWSRGWSLAVRVGNLESAPQRRMLLKAE
jgi:hypothetical protein